MTIRTLLKSLHDLAAKMGADTPIEVRGMSRRVKILGVKESDIAVIQISGMRLTKAEKDNRQLGYFRARYKRLRDAGKCVRCTQPVLDGKGECKTCQRKQSFKRNERNNKKNNI